MEIRPSIGTRKRENGKRLGEPLNTQRDFVCLVPEATSHLQEPGLREWSTRDLIGHTSRALSTVDSYLANRATTVAVESPAAYFSRILSTSGGPVTVAQQGGNDF